jgi:hypothetical protein
MKRRLFVLIAVILIALLIRVAIIYYHGDSTYEPDGYLHFLQAKYLFQDWPINSGLLINVWAKPLYLLIFAGWLKLFAAPTLIHAKLLNVLISGLLGIAVYVVARRLKFDFTKSMLAVILTSFSFLLLRSTTSELTEPLAALILLISFAALIKKRFTLAILILGLSVFIRLEFILLFPLWLVFIYLQLPALALRTKILKLIPYAVLLIIPLIIWNVLGYLQTGSVFFLLSKGYPLQQGLYSFGYPWHYLEGLAVQEPIILLLGLIGFTPIAARLYRQISLKQMPDFQRVDYLWILFGYYLVIQTLLYMFGLFGTAGMMRYFVPVMPFLALFAAQSLDQLAYNKQKLAQNTFVVFVCLISLISSISQIRQQLFFKSMYNQPPLATEQIKNYKLLGDYSGLANTPYYCSNRPEILYYNNLPYKENSYCLYFDHLWNDAPSGSVFIVDRNWYEQYNSGYLTDIARRGDYTMLPIINNCSKEACIFIFIKI